MFKGILQRRGGAFRFFREGFHRRESSDVYSLDARHIRALSIQYRHKYVAKIKSQEPVGIDLICGNAAHVVLQGVLDTYRRTGNHPGDLEARIENALVSSATHRTAPGRMTSNE